MIFAAAVFLSSCTSAAAPAHGSTTVSPGRPLPTPVVTAPLPPCTWALVTRIVDGDTVKVDLIGKTETVRYIGMDTPETVAPGKPVQPFGPEASAANRALVEGKQVCLEKDISDRDSFGRLLRDAWLPDGTLVGEALVEAGLARVVTFPPDVRYIDTRLLPAQARARGAGRGLWEGYLEDPSPTAGPPPACFVAGKNSCNCGDFTTHSEAQTFHDTYDPTDVNRLDSNGDGLVCEGLP
jgi:micrococcal nuclease